jgi:RNA polymerase sigma factor (TIGR02999 family)
MVANLSVTSLLEQSTNGNREALDLLMPIVYDQLKRLAARYLQDERPEHTLKATALVHEAYLKLVESEISWQNRAHFFAISAQVLRHVLVDHAKARNRHKRGGGLEKIALDDAVMVGTEVAGYVLDLDDALKRLAERDPRKSQVIELLFFGGLTYDEAAEAMGVSPATVHRELILAKAWMHRELSQTRPGHS